MFSNLLVGSSISFTDTFLKAFKLTRFDQLQCMLYPFLSFLHSTNNSVLIIEWREKKRENETRQVSGLFSWKKETKREERKRKHSRRCQRLIMISLFSFPKWKGDEQTKCEEEWWFSNFPPFFFCGNKVNTSGSTVVCVHEDHRQNCQEILCCLPWKIVLMPAWICLSFSSILVFYFCISFDWDEAGKSLILS